MPSETSWTGSHGWGGSRRGGHIELSRRGIIEDNKSPSKHTSSSEGTEMGLFNKKDESSGWIVTEVWGQRGWHNRDIVGESHYSSAIRALLPRELDDGGVEAITPVTIVHNPTNEHDKNAVEARASSGLLGFLSKEEARDFAPVLAVLQANGRVAGTTARLYGYLGYQDYESDRTQFIGSVRVDLPEPHVLFPTNLPPERPHTILPEGSAIQVTGEEQHMAALQPFLTPKGECWVYATLHSVAEHSARTSKIIAEVRIDGLPVGRLTPKMSRDMLPVVEYLGDRDHVTCVHATVKGNQLKADVALHAIRSGELPSEWFASIPISPSRKRSQPTT